MNNSLIIMLATTCLALSAQTAWAEASPEKLFMKNCSVCHRADNKGMGSAVEKMSADVAILHATIADGRNGMPAFGEKLGDKKIKALTSYIQSHQPLR